MVETNIGTMDFLVAAPNLLNSITFCIKTPSSTDLAYHKSSSLMSKYVVFEYSLCKIRSRFNKNAYFFKALKEYTLAVRSGKVQNGGYPK